METLICILLVLGVASHINGLTIQGTEEGSCTQREIEPQANIDRAWLGQVKNWYVSAGSRYHIYRALLHHLGNETFENTPEYSMYYEACPTIYSDLTLDSSISVLNAFKPGTESYHNTIKVRDGVYDYIAVANRSSTVPAGVGTSRHYITLTDNQSFVFFTNCQLEADQYSWDILSVKPTLDPHAFSMIEEHAISKGFDKKKFEFLRYDSCAPGMGIRNWRGGKKFWQDGGGDNNAPWQGGFGFDRRGPPSREHGPPHGFGGGSRGPPPHGFGLGPRGSGPPTGFGSRGGSQTAGFGGYAY